jgi:Cu(I)-responsive transcriptional regulator
MNISQAARESGLPPKTIRYYEQIELISPPARNANGYRLYDRQALAELRFVHRARDVGFSVEECRQLLEIQRNPRRRSAHVKSMVLEKCQQIEERITRLKGMHDTLQALASECSGDEGPECAILDELGAENSRVGNDG